MGEEAKVIGDTDYVTRDQLIEMLDTLEVNRIEPMEQQFAQLTVGYAELSAAFESLLFSLFGTGESPEAEAFKQKFDEVRGGMMRWLNDAVKHVGVDGESLNETVAKLVREQQPDSSPASSGTGPGDGSTS